MEVLVLLFLKVRGLWNEQQGFVSLCVKKKKFALFKEWETSFYIFKDLKEFNRKSYEVRWEGKAWNITGFFLISLFKIWDLGISN